MTRYVKKMSEAVGDKLLGCLASVSSMHDVLLSEGVDPSGARFETVRYALAAVVTFLNGKRESDVTDGQFKQALHELLDMALMDYEYNRHLHEAATSN